MFFSPPNEKVSDNVSRRRSFIVSFFASFSLSAFIPMTWGGSFLIFPSYCRWAVGLLRFTGCCLEGLGTYIELEVSSSLQFLLLYYLLFSYLKPVVCLELPYLLLSGMISARWNMAGEHHFVKKKNRGHIVFKRRCHRYSYCPM